MMRTEQSNVSEGQRIDLRYPASWNKASSWQDTIMSRNGTEMSFELWRSDRS